MEAKGLTFPTHIDFATTLSPRIRFGTSTWTYPGWKGLLYKDQYKNEKDFKSRSLREYAQCPLFRTVGIDHAFYRPPSASLLREYSAMVPKEFQWISKVWETITAPSFPDHPRYGGRKGKQNPDFLNAELFVDAVLSAYDHDGIRDHTGPFVFQFPFIAEAVLSREAFLAQLDAFLGKLPSHFRYALEVRNPQFLTKDYFSIINSRNATHCFNHWNFMPRLREQMRSAAEAGGLTAPFFVARILTPLGVSYEHAVKLFAPYDQIKRPNQEMREDVVRLVRRALEREIEAYIIVNNRCEGNSPMTIDGIMGLLAHES